MKRRGASMCRLGLTLVALSLAGPIAAGQPLPDPVVSAEGKYGVRFPGKPKSSTAPVKTDVGTLTVHTSSFATTGGNVFLVIYTDYPPPPLRPEATEALLNGVRDGLTKDGKLRSDQPAAVGPTKTPGREIVVDKGAHQLRYRVVLNGNRLYQVGVLGGMAFVDGPEAKAFLDSFEITK